MASLRLKKICNLVDENSIVADIGTDHGIIPIELSKNNMSKKIIATDISKSCLEKLEQKLIYNSNIVNIETRVSDGLDCFDEFEVDTIIISGMGGILIKEILEKNLNV
ncbi:MAG: SAM-dependent methyltransferase, partial [Parvimonas micra]|nr:SAM-dependent methyltransferase [Parvimonas micra]